MRELLEEIAQTNEYEIGELLKAVLQWYAVLFPDWDVSTISLNKSADRNEQLDRVIGMLENMKTSP